jgi:hypothetical protein
VAYSRRSRPLGGACCRRASAALALLLALGSCSRGGGPSADAEQRAQALQGSGERYPLDGLPRKRQGRAPCPTLELSEFAGERIRFVPAARVAPAFRSRLVELERAVREVALRFYDRAPDAILIAASYDCRSVSGSAGRLSEHALGNAIDISGFRFAPVTTWWANFPAAFEVRIDGHWKARGSALERRHARFLQQLTRTLIERDVFRTLLGPAHPNHRDHFHFDMAPSRYVHL